MTRPDIGTEIPERTFTVTRLDVIRYCGASGDFNPLHWSDRRAQAVGLPGVIAHGMLTLAIVGRALTDLYGHGNVRSYGARFSRPFAVPDDDDGQRIVVRGRIVDATADELSLELDVRTADSTELLKQASAVVSMS